MPEEIEVPTEHLQESLKEAAEHGGGEEGPSWIGKVALTAALLAVTAAIAALMAGHHANEAMLEQMKATDQWGYYQAKGIKMSQVETKLQILTALGKEGHEDDKKKIEKYEKEQEGIKEKAEEMEHSSEHHMEHHVRLARAVTAYQVAISASAISVLSRKKFVWYLGIVLGIVGTAFMIQGLV